MESNKIADKVRRKLLGLRWCNRCLAEVKPTILGEGTRREIGVCPECGYMTKRTNSEDMGTIRPHKETK